MDAMPPESWDPYPASSAGAGQLPDAFGPDGIRVSLRVEPAVDRWRRALKMTMAPNPRLPAAVVRAEQGFVAGLLQRYAFGGRWIVDVEADSGRRLRIGKPTRDDAIATAKRIHAGVGQRGVAFLDSPGR